MYDYEFFLFNVFSNTLLFSHILYGEGTAENELNISGVFSVCTFASTPMGRFPINIHFSFVTDL